MIWFVCVFKKRICLFYRLGNLSLTIKSETAIRDFRRFGVEAKLTEKRVHTIESNVKMWVALKS